jgi:pyruvate kinase
MRTKIIATLGPASTNLEIMTSMVESGVRIFRFNFSHASAADFKPVVELVRQVEDATGVALTAMGDLCGPKTRIGDVEGSPVTVNKGETVNLGLPSERSESGNLFIELDFPELLHGLEVGMPVSLSDGMLQFVITRIVKDNVLFEMQAQNSGLITSHKGITFPGKSHAVPAMTDKDRTDLHEGLDIGLDAFALSFVQTRQDIVDIKSEIDKHGVWVPVVAKIERQNAVDNIESILDLADAIMVARGDLGLECPLSQVPIIQKRLIRAARHKQKAAIVATQMLLSMVKSPLPTRAETTDVANAILDGADCVMLSEETAIGNYPAEAVGFIKEIATGAEAYFLERVQGPYAPKREWNPSKYLTYAAALLAENTESGAIVCHSRSGATARMLSSRRPGGAIHALTPEAKVQRSLNFFWGVTPHMVREDLPGHVERAEEFIDRSDLFAKGESVVITAGQPTPGMPETSTNSIKIYYK